MIINRAKYAVFCVIIFSFFSCSISRAIYPGPNNSPERKGSTVLGVVYSAENINGNFPEKVYIKTRTQTFDLYNYYILHGGKIWYKSIEGEPKVWTLFEGSGLPHSFRRPDHPTTYWINEISADADELVALSVEGGFYRFCADINIAHQSNVWLGSQGWPSKEQLFFDSRTARNISWALGKRNKHVLYYEDTFGNQHHNGTMEIVTTYVLLEDGQEICYADTGLPSDFSRNYIGPEHGKFKAAALSASASTMFVINDAGEMYTRLADYDTTGCDPMWFKYTYIPYKSDLPGTNFFSNLNEWALPPEEWRAQPPIPLSGRAALTRHITILQNGQGNGARELRVAGLDSDANTGYWSKAIFAGQWEFKPAPLNFDPSAIIETAEDRAGSGQDEIPRGERGPSLDKSYRGSAWTRDEKEEGLHYEIPDFNILEGGCELLITRRDETCALKLHPVEMWTYLKRDYAPGRTGVPKVFFVTMEIPPGAFDPLSEDFAEELKAKYAGNDKKLFHYVMTAGSRYIIMQDFDKAEPVLFLTDGTVSESYPDFRYMWHVEDFEELRLCYAPGLIISPDAPLTEELLAKKISLNRELIAKLKYRRRELRWGGLANVSFSTTYLPLHFFASLTPLRFLDMPKIRTMTRYGDQIILANNAHIVSTSTVNSWLITKIIEHLDLRIEYYEALAKDLGDGGGSVRTSADMSVSPYYSENVSDYWDIAGLPKSIQGFFFGAKPEKRFSEIPAELKFIHSGAASDISGWHLAIGESGDFLIMIDPKKSAGKIYSRRGRSPEERSLRLDCALYIKDSPTTGEEARILEDCLKPLIPEARQYVRVQIRFDGNKFEIRDVSSHEGQRLIFRGNL